MGYLSDSDSSSSDSDSGFKLPTRRPLAAKAAPPKAAPSKPAAPKPTPKKKADSSSSDDSSSSASGFKLRRPLSPKPKPAPTAPKVSSPPPAKKKSILGDSDSDSDSSESKKVVPPKPKAAAPKLVAASDSSSSSSEESSKFKVPIRRPLSPKPKADPPPPKKKSLLADSDSDSHSSEDKKPTPKVATPKPAAPKLVAPSDSSSSSDESSKFKVPTRRPLSPKPKESPAPAPKANPPAPKKPSKLDSDSDSDSDSNSDESSKFKVPVRRPLSPKPKGAPPPPPKPTIPPPKKSFLQDSDSDSSDDKKVKVASPTPKPAAPKPAASSDSSSSSGSDSGFKLPSHRPMSPKPKPAVTPSPPPKSNPPQLNKSPRKAKSDDDSDSDESKDSFWDEFGGKPAPKPVQRGKAGSSSDSSSSGSSKDKPIAAKVAPKPATPAKKDDSSSGSSDSSAGKKHTPMPIAKAFPKSAPTPKPAAQAPTKTVSEPVAKLVPKSVDVPRSPVDAADKTSPSPKPNLSIAERRKLLMDKGVDSSNSSTTGSAKPTNFVAVAEKRQHLDSSLSSRSSKPAERPSAQARKLLNDDGNINTDSSTSRSSKKKIQTEIDRTPKSTIQVATAATNKPAISPVPSSSSSQKNITQTPAEINVPSPPFPAPGELGPSDTTGEKVVSAPPEEAFKFKHLAVGEASKKDEVITPVFKPPMLTISVMPEDDESAFGSSVGSGFRYTNRKYNAKLRSRKGYPPIPPTDIPPPSPDIPPSPPGDVPKSPKDGIPKVVEPGLSPKQAVKADSSSVEKSKGEDTAKGMALEEPLKTEEKDKDIPSWLVPGSGIPREKTEGATGPEDQKDPPGARTSFSQTVSHYIYPVPSGNYNGPSPAFQLGSMANMATPQWNYNTRLVPPNWSSQTPNLEVVKEAEEWEPWVPSIPYTSRGVRDLHDRNSDSSSGSNWVPKELQSTREREESTRENEEKKPLDEQHPKKTGLPSGSDHSTGSQESKTTFGWMPPERYARVDFTGSVRSGSGSSESQYIEEIIEEAPALFGGEYGSVLLDTIEKAETSDSSSNLESVSSRSGSRSGSGTRSGSQSGSGSRSKSGSELSSSSGSDSRSRSSSSSSGSSSGSGSDSSSGSMSAESLKGGEEKHGGMHDSRNSDIKFTPGEPSKPNKRSKRPEPPKTRHNTKKPEVNRQAVPPESANPSHVHFQNLQGRLHAKSDDEEESASTTSSDKKLYTQPSIDNRAIALGCCLCFLCLLVVLAILIPVLLTRDNRKKEGPPSSPTFTPIGPPSNNPGTNPPNNGGGGPLEDLIVSVSLDGGSALLNPSSPQSKALDWLSNNQFLHLYEDDQKIQRYVLATMYYSTSGDSWNNNNLWLSDENECDWYTAESENPVCNIGGTLDELDLDRNGMSGQLPWRELALLSSNLLVMDLFENDLSGPISGQIRRLTSLQVLDFFSNQHTGTLPTQLGMLSSIKYVDMSTNFISGTIPTELSTLTNLESLWLNNNFLSGTIPSELGRMTSLQNLYLSGNYLEGSVPEELCSLNLKVLDVNCELVACDCCQGCSSIVIDDPLYDLVVSASPDGGQALQRSGSPQFAAFEWLQSNANDGISSEQQLLQRYALATLYYSTGGQEWTTSPAWLSSEDECDWYTTGQSDGVCDSNGNYVKIVLEGNNLVGSLPLEILLLSDNLEILNLAQNELEGTIPTQFTQLSVLKRLDLGSNQFIGSIPSQIGEMTSLRRLSFFSNLLFSTIPTEVGLLRNLEVLDFGSNELTGWLPTTLGMIVGLAGLSVFDNFLSGTIPEQLANLLSLELLYLDSTNLDGPIPDSVCELDFEEFWSDCEETQCLCCTTCCSDNFGCVDY